VKRMSSALALSLSESSKEVVSKEVVSKEVVSKEVVSKEVVLSSKRGRPARTKVVKEVDWLEGLSSGVEVGRELELVVVGGDEKETKKAEALALKEAKKAEALAAKEAKKAEELALKETKKAEELAL